MMEQIPNNASVASHKDDIGQFLCEIRGYPLLSAEEEKELALRCASGDESAIRQMVTSNLRLVVHVAREYAGRGVPLLDLIQEGSIGLLVAARKFDPSLDYRFSTYATKWIRQGVTRCLFNNSGVIRIPLHTAEKIRKIESVRTALHQQKKEEPTLAEIASILGISVARINELMQLRPDVFSLDLPSGEDDKNTVGEILSDLEALQPQEALVRQELEKAIQTMLASLNERQQRILRMHFGLENGHTYSLDEIGKTLGISKERVRQIERQAMDKLQEMGTSMGLEDFLNE